MLVHQRVTPQDVSKKWLENVRDLESEDVQDLKSTSLGWTHVKIRWFHTIFWENFPAMMTPEGLPSVFCSCSLMPMHWLITISVASQAAGAAQPIAEAAGMAIGNVRKHDEKAPEIFP